ncbi:MAG: Trm112 family protein [Alphaproteobacteria bacterium]|nr:Trm112 family protein [Alphaproteobacteria bacterium]
MQQIEFLELEKIIQCPISGGKLVYNKEKNMFYSPAAKVFFPIENGILMLIKNCAVAE